MDNLDQFYRRACELLPEDSACLDAVRAHRSSQDIISLALLEGYAAEANTLKAVLMGSHR